MAEATADTAKYPGVTPHLSSKDAAGAADFYKRAFGAEETSRMSTDDGKRLMHCELVINGGALMLADAMPEHGWPWKEPEGATLNLIVENAHAWWDRAVDAGCEVVMPLEIMFWGDWYGQLTDPFGHRWAIVGPAEKK